LACVTGCWSWWFFRGAKKTHQKPKNTKQKTKQKNLVDEMGKRGRGATARKRNKHAVCAVDVAALANLCAVQMLRVLVEAGAAKGLLPATQHKDRLLSTAATLGEPRPEYKYTGEQASKPAGWDARHLSGRGARSITAASSGGASHMMTENGEKYT
jgi:hypothetical protein